jgi:hypothetical protein
LVEKMSLGKKENKGRERGRGIIGETGKGGEIENYFFWMQWG